MHVQRYLDGDLYVCKRWAAYASAASDSTKVLNLTENENSYFQSVQHVYFQILIFAFKIANQNCPCSVYTLHFYF